MKRHVLIVTLVLCAASVPLVAQTDMAFRTFAENASLYLGSPSSVGNGWNGYLNPALLATAQAPELLLIATNPPGEWASVSEVGVFGSSSGFGLGALYFSDADGQPQMDLRTSLGFGNRSFAFGLSNETAMRTGTGQILAFEAVTIGALFRPWPFASLGLVGTSTYSGSAMEGTVELGIRPFGTPVATIFGNYTLGAAGGILSSAWGAGVALEPADGILLAGRLASDLTFTLGAQVSLGVTDVAGSVRFASGFEPQRATYAARVGPRPAPSVVSEAMNRKAYYLELNLRGTIAARGSPLGNSHSLLALLTMIGSARDDPSIAGIAVNASGLQADSESVWELREQLRDFRSIGKHVVVFIDTATLPLYYLASVADRIVMDPEGQVQLLGAVAGAAYFKGTLEKLGIGFQELRLFEYKSAAETFSRDSFSDADRRQNEAYLSDVYGFIKAEIIKDRNLSDDAFESIVNDRFILGPGEARELGLVDAIGRREEVKSAITALEGREKSFITYGAEYQPTGIELLAALAGAPLLGAPASELWSEPPRIAVIYALGSTSLDSGMMARKLAKVIESAADDCLVKAIVLRVDSPGGDAIAADYVAEAVKAARKWKPVIVSQGAVAGSGGYWVSMYGDSIVSSPFSVTGSIGVISSWFYDNGFNEKLGASTDLVKIGAHADLGFGLLFPDRKLTQEEIDRFDTLILTMYGDFVSKVAEGRGKTKEEIESIAQGRIWSGLRARDIGLVDSIGGLEAAIALARQRAGIEPGQEVRIVELPAVDPFAFLPLIGASMAGIDAWGGGELSLREARMLEYVRFRLAHNGEPLLLMEPEGAFAQ